jgi:hypothetical protein
MTDYENQLEEMSMILPLIEFIFNSFELLGSNI